MNVSTWLVYYFNHIHWKGREGILFPLLISIINLAQLIDRLIEVLNDLLTKS